MAVQQKYARSATNPGALLNTDMDALNAYKLQRKYMHNSVETGKRLEKLESSVEKLTQILTQLLESK